jgi:hypothetical protein
MTQPPIDKGIPIPNRFPFEQMEVGDSFAVPDGLNRTTVSVADNRYCKKNDREYITRTIPDKTVRCWRTK